MKTRDIIIISVLGAFLGLSIGFGWLMRKESIQSKEALESLKNSLYELSMERDSLWFANDSLNRVLAKYQYLNDSLDVLVVGNQRQIRYLNYELNKALKEIDDLSDSAVYEGVKDEYAVDITSTSITAGETYTFTGDETREIYKDVKRVNYLDSIRIQQDEMINRMLYKLQLKDEVIFTLKEDNRRKEALLQRLYQDLANATVQHDMSEAENRRLRKTLALWKGGSLTAGAAVLALLIIL